MKDPQKPTMIFTLGALVFFVALFVIALGYDLQTGSAPLGAAIIGMVLSILLLASQLYPPIGRFMTGGYFRTMQSSEQPRNEVKQEHDVLTLIYTLIFIVASFGLILLFGFLLGGPTSVFIWFKWFVRVSFLRSVIWGCLTLLATQLLFQMASGLILFQGLLFGGMIT